MLHHKMHHFCICAAQLSQGVNIANVTPITSSYISNQQISTPQVPIGQSQSGQSIAQIPDWVMSNLLSGPNARPRGGIYQRSCTYISNLTPPWTHSLNIHQTALTNTCYITKCIIFAYVLHNPDRGSI